MNELQIREAVTKQQEFFLSGATLSIDFRRESLRKLREGIQKYEAEINEAVRKDLGKSQFEAYMCETGMVLSEITYMLKHMSRYSKNKRVGTPLAQFASKSFISPRPYGTVLIMSPWNYPFMLTLDPMVDAIAAGNTVVLKPSAYSQATTEVIGKIMKEYFPENYVLVVTGGREENKCLLEQKFDYIFFTGGITVGKEVMRKAAEYLTPITLELGGKSPCIIDASADIELAAKRLVFGKYLNCGQTCVAPDYVYCDSQIKDKFIAAVKKQIDAQYTPSPLKNKDYGKIINRKHFDRIVGLINREKVVHGGTFREDTLQIEPTVMDQVTFNDAVMQEEIFGPVMPIITYNSLEEAVKKLQTLPHPLAFYLFSTKKANIKYVLDRCQFGGGCINDTIIHLATSNMGFGGVGNSGMGSYHGKRGFDAFSHYRSIVDKKNWLDLPMRYQPYKGFNLKLLHLFLK